MKNILSVCPYWAFFLTPLTAGDFGTNTKASDSYIINNPLPMVLLLLFRYSFWLQDEN